MAFSCGFFNSLNGDKKYNTRQISQIFDGIIRDGVYASVGNKLTVKQGTGMQVIVDTGRAWFNHTWSLNDSELPVTVEAADLVLNRIDAVVLEVDESLEVRDNQIKMVKGTAASEPQKPTMTNSEFVHQYPLAYISVKKGVTSITTSDIEINVGKDDCPYVTSVLEAASIEELYAQWESQFSGWEEGQKTQFEAWFAEIKGQLGEDAAGNLQLQIDAMENRIENEGAQIYTHSRSGTVHEFTGSGPNGRAKMTADVQTGDTFTVNGTPVTAYVGTDDATGSMAGSAWTGKWITFVYDSESSILNFKGGGGKVTVSGLSAGVVKKGTTVTVKQGAKVVSSVEGTLIYAGACVAPTIMAHCSLGQHASDNGFLSFFPLGFISDGSFRISGNQLICDVAGTYNIQCSVQKKNSWTFAYGVDLRLNGSNIDTDPIASSFQRTLNKGDYFQFYYHVSTDENGTNAAAVACLKIDRVG